jgi:hypothetical protein
MGRDYAYASTFSFLARRPFACSRRATFGEPDACFASRNGIMRAMSFLRLRTTLLLNVVFWRPWPAVIDAW